MWFSRVCEENSGQDHFRGLFVMPNCLRRHTVLAGATVLLVLKVMMFWQVEISFLLLSNVTPIRSSMEAFTEIPHVHATKLKSTVVGLALSSRWRPRELGCSFCRAPNDVWVGDRCYHGACEGTPLCLIHCRQLFCRMRGNEKEEAAATSWRISSAVRSATYRTTKVWNCSQS